MFIVLLQGLESGNLRGRGQAAKSLSSLRLLQNRGQEAEALADLVLTQSHSDPQALVCLVSHDQPGCRLSASSPLYYVTFNDVMNLISNPVYSVFGDQEEFQVWPCYLYPWCLAGDSASFENRGMPKQQQATWNKPGKCMQMPSHWRPTTTMPSTITGEEPPLTGQTVSNLHTLSSSRSFRDTNWGGKAVAHDMPQVF